MEDLVIAVEERMRRLSSFDANTRKWVARLQTEADIRARLRMLQMNWTQFSEAWIAWKQAAAKCPDVKVAKTFDNDQYDNAELDWGSADGTTCWLRCCQQRTRNHRQVLQQKEQTTVCG